MGNVYRAVARRLASVSIKIEDYIYHDANGSTLEEKSTILDGITFVAQNKVKPGGAPVVGIDDLRDAFHFAIGSEGKRAFAGQLRKEDLNHGLLQASFGNTKGLGFREIFYLSQLPKPTRDPRVGNVIDADGRGFDARFGKQIDTVDVSSLHAALLGPTTRPALPGPAKAGPKTNDMKARSSIHIDESGFVFADSDGRIFLSSQTFQHIGDELVIKDKLLGGTSPLSFFLHTDLNSISDPTLGSQDIGCNNFLRNCASRAVLGLELATKSDGVQLFARGSLTIEGRGLGLPAATDASAVVGIRRRF